MQALDLNLASRPCKNDTLPWVGVGVAVVVLVVLTVWNIRTYQVHSALTADLQVIYSETRSELDQFGRRDRGAQRDIEGFNVETLTVRADKANEVIGWKAFSWTQLFNLLQEVLPNDVQMVSIRPVFRPQVTQRRRDGTREEKGGGLIPVSVEGASKSMEAFFELERALQDHPHFERVDPEGTTQLTRGGPVSFQLNFHYDPTPDPVPSEIPEAEPVEVAAAQPEQAVGDETPPAAGVGEDLGGDVGGDEPEQAGVEDAAPTEALGTPAVPLPVDGAPAADADPATPEQKPGPKPPGGRKGKRRSGGRGTEGTP